MVGPALAFVVHPRDPIRLRHRSAIQSAVSASADYGRCMPASTDLLPALSVIGSATKRTAILELAAEAEQRGFAGLACPGVGGNLALCASLAHVTNTIAFWSSIQPIYLAHPMETAATAAHIAEVSGGRFRLGLGVSHLPMLDRIGLATGKPLSDMRDYVTALRKAERGAGAMPPILLAALRDRMLDLAVEIADGALWANASLSHTPQQVAANRARTPRANAAGQHGADGDRRRPRCGACHPPTNARRLHRVAELSQLLAGGRLRRGDGRHRSCAAGGRSRCGDRGDERSVDRRLHHQRRRHTGARSPRRNGTRRA